MFLLLLLVFAYVRLTWENIKWKIRLVMVLTIFSSYNDWSDVTVEVRLRSELNLSFLEVFCFDLAILSPPYSEDITLLFCLYIWSFIVNSSRPHWLFLNPVESNVSCLELLGEIYLSEMMFVNCLCVFLFISPTSLYPDIFSQHKTYLVIFPPGALKTWKLKARWGWGGRGVCNLYSKKIPIWSNLIALLLAGKESR